MAQGAGRDSVLSTRRDAGGSNPPLSITPSGDGYRTTAQLNAMIKGETVFASIIVTAFGLGILAGPVAGYFIDKATTKQCLNHDWPKEANQIHRDWCIANGYKI